MKHTHHIIRSFKWNIDCLDTARHLFEPDQVIDFHQVRLLPALEEYLEKKWKTEAYIRIPKITVDLDIEGDAGLEEKVTRQIISEIENQILEATQFLTDAPTVGTGNVGSFDLANQPIEQKGEEKEDPSLPAIKESLLENDWQAFETFLLSGVMPWWKNEPLEELSIRLLEQKESLTRMVFRSLNAGDQKPMRRLFYQFSNDWISEAFIAIKPEKKVKEFNKLKKWVESLPVTGSEKEEIEIRFKAFLLVLHWSRENRGQSLDIPNLLPPMLSFLIENKNIAKKILRDSNWIEKELPEVMKDWPEDFSVAIQKTLDSAGRDEGYAIPEKLDTSEVFTKTNSKTSNNDNLQDFPYREERKFIEQESKLTQSVDWKEGIFADHLGLVILSPYLELFFENLGLMERQKFVDSERQEQAAHLLYYLATGMVSPTEEEMVVPKLLTGWPIGEPLKKIIDLSSRALEESEELLDSVITNWGVLKNTDQEGLRETFLTRSGKVIRKQTHWEVWVEQKGIDILLRRLPWGLSPIYLPWLPKSLIVNWT